MFKLAHFRAGNSGPGSIQRHTIPAAQTHYELDNNSPLPAFYEIWLTATNRAGTGEKSKVLRYSPGLKGSTTSSSAICSFGRRLVVPWKTAVDLPCHVLLLSGGSNSQPSISWTHNGKPIERLSSLVSNRTAHQQHFRLSLTDLKRTDGGNYTCSIRNTGESVTYQVAVLGKPKVLIFCSSVTTNVGCSSTGSCDAPHRPNRPGADPSPMEQQGRQQ